MPPSLFWSPEERRFAELVSRIATCNPFLPDRVELEEQALGGDFEATGPVWSKQLHRENPNVRKLAARTEELARTLRTRLAQTEAPDPTEEEATLYDFLVSYLLYYRFEEDFERAMSGSVGFYPSFIELGEWYLKLPKLRPHLEVDLSHWFAFLFQIRRASHHIFDYIVGDSMPAARLRADVWQSIFTHDFKRYRRSLYDRMGDLATLIIGASGTGKELVAKAIGMSRYIPFEPKQERFAIDPTRAYFPLNLSAMAPTLIESELFGHRRGAFTGALSDRKGWLSICPPLGAVFLDEIGELDASIQVKLLRVLQSREFQPLGDTKTSSFEGKILAATNRDLAEEMRAQRFRPDLYYRLCSDLVATPSLSEQLRDRPEDLPKLVAFIARRVVGPTEAGPVTEEVTRWIRNHMDPDYDWPGNVRELEQCIRNVVIRREYRPRGAARSDGDQADWLAALQRGRLTAEELLQAYCALVYRQTGSYSETARRLGIDRRTVKSRIEARAGSAPDE